MYCKRVGCCSDMQYFVLLVACRMLETLQFTQYFLWRGWRLSSYY